MPEFDISKLPTDLQLGYDNMFDTMFQYVRPGKVVGELNDIRVEERVKLEREKLYDAGYAEKETRLLAMIPACDAQTLSWEQ